MKQGAILINTSRGPTVDEAAMLAALQAGRIVAALDVYDKEPLPPDHPLRHLSNTVLMPHLGYGVKETWGGFYPQMIENALAFMDGRARPRHQSLRFCRSNVPLKRYVRERHTGRLKPRARDRAICSGRARASLRQTGPMLWDRARTAKTIRDPLPASSGTIPGRGRPRGPSAPPRSPDPPPTSRRRTPKIRDVLQHHPRISSPPAGSGSVARCCTMSFRSPARLTLTTWMSGVKSSRGRNAGPARA